MAFHQLRRDRSDRFGKLMLKSRGIGHIDLRHPRNLRRRLRDAVGIVADDQRVDVAELRRGGHGREGRVLDVAAVMWSRRAQEYEAKINSGDLTSIAEVTRDLFRPDDAPEQSYSERQIFEAASSRLARELGAMEQTDEKAALAKILEILNKAALIHHKTKEPA